MKTIILTAIKTVIIGLASMGTLYASTESDSREKFLELITDYASAFNDQESMAVCTTWNARDGEQTENYYFEVKKDIKTYKDAFALSFRGAKKLNLSTLIAYEGFNNHQMGLLRVIHEDDRSVFTHTFDGFYIAELSIEISKETNSTSLSFKKSRFQKTVISIKCQATPAP